MREVQALPRGQVRLDGRPLRDLAGVGEEVLDDRAARGRLSDLEEVLALDPAVRDRLVPRAATPLADDHVEAVVLEVERLPRALDAVADHGDRLVRETFAGLLEGPLVAGDDGLDLVTELNLGHVVLRLRVPSPGAGGIR